MRVIFLIGEQRSGSNLLRLMLNQHTQISAPHPPHILQRFTPLLPLYGDLNKEENLEKLITDVCELIRRNPIPWPKNMLDVLTIKKHLKEASLVGILEAIMQVYTQFQNTDFILCKSMQNVRWLKEIQACFKNPLFIYLHRDPRDVALSFKKAVVGEKNVYFIAKRWKELQELCLQATTEVAAENFMQLSYEKLTTEPTKTLNQICTFLQIPFQEKMLAYCDSEEANIAAKSSSLWQNLKKPIIALNQKKYLKEMTSEEIQIVEKVSFDCMRQLGYEALYEKNNNSNFTSQQIQAWKIENEERKKAIRMQADQEDMARRNHQLCLLEDIKKAKN